MLAIVVQICTCVVAMLGMYRAENRPGWRQFAAFALVTLTALSIVLTIQTNREAEYIRWGLEAILGATPASESRQDEIVQRVAEHAVVAGFPVMKRSAYNDKLQVLEFFHEGSSARSGLIAINYQDLSKLSAVPPSTLGRAVAEQLTRAWGVDSLDGDWNLIVSKIQDIALHVFRQESKGPINILIWADVDRKYIAVGPPDGNSTTPPKDRAEFPEPELRRLLSLSTFARGDSIARACSRLVRKS
jgi:hypothetical protein